MVRKGYENFASASVGYSPVSSNQLWRTTKSLRCFAGVLWAILFAVMSFDEVFDLFKQRKTPGWKIFPSAAMLKME